MLSFPLSFSFPSPKSQLSLSRLQGFKHEQEELKKAGTRGQETDGERVSLPPADLQPGRAAVRDAGLNSGVHSLLHTALCVRVRAAVAGAEIQTQALQLPDCVSVLVSAVGGSACASLLVLF